MAKGDLEGKSVPNKKLKCYMMKNAKNGAVYRTCATPSGDKKPKKQVRGKPKPANQRQDKYLVAYPNGRPKPAKKAKKPATKAKPPAKPKAKPKAKPPAKPKAKPATKAKKPPAKPKATTNYLEKAKKSVVKGGAKVSKSMPKKTHTMPDGTVMSGATHTASSKPVKKAPAKPKKAPAEDRTPTMVGHMSAKEATKQYNLNKINNEIEKYVKSQNWVEKYSSPNLTKRFKKIKTEEKLRDLMNTLKQELNDKQSKTNDVMRKMNEEVRKIDKRDTAEDRKKIKEIVKIKKKYEKNIKNIVNTMMDFFNEKKNEISKN